MEIIAGEKSKLADSINVAFKEDPSVEADPVTARYRCEDAHSMKIRYDAAKEFGIRQGFYTSVSMCWSHEQVKCQRNNQKCLRLDQRTLGVRRIHITGHAI